MIKVSVTDSKKLKYILESIAEIVDEATFSFEQDCFKINGADPSIISKIEVYLSKDFFSDFNVGETWEVGVDMSSLDKVAKRILSDDEVSILTTNNESSLGLVLNGGIERKFNAPLIEMTNNLPKISLDFPVFLEMETEVFRNSVKDLAVAGGSVVFEAIPDKMVLSSVGELGNAVVTIMNDNSVVKDMKVSKPCSARYNISYLMSFLKAGLISNYIRIFFGDKDYPLKLEFQFENGQMVFYLAPMEY